MTNGPFDPVAVPPKTPPVYSLVNSATTPTEPDANWTAGLAYHPEPCDNSGIFDPCGTATLLGDSPGDDSRPAEVRFEPFGVYSFARCTTKSQLRVRGLPAEARRNLIATESKQIAYEFWEGAFAQAPNPDRPNVYLRKAGATILSAAAGVSPTAALACLEQSLADCGSGSRGMIHATSQVATYWFERELVETDGKIAYTKLGTSVVVDAGYTGAAPIGTTDNSGVSWAYATDWVTVRRSEIEDFPGNAVQAVKRDTNDVAHRVERVAAVTFDGCCRAAIGVQVTSCLAIEFAS